MATVHHAIPVGDKRNYILKDGVLQGSHTLNWKSSTYYGGTVVYDSTEKALVLTQDTFDHANQGCTLTVDVTNFNHIDCSWSNPVLGYLGICLASETYPNQQRSSYIDVSAMTGNVTFFFNVRQTSNIGDKSYLRSIWLE